MDKYQEALLRWLNPMSVPPKLGQDVFGPRPEDLEPFVDSEKTRAGENSYEYAQALMDLGNACMVQCDYNLALESCERALSIYRSHGEETYLTAWAYDMTASIKQACHDYPGAVAALTRAVEIWNHLAEQTTGEVVLPDRILHHMTRRREDLERMRRVLEFESRKPPDL